MPALLNGGTSSPVESPSILGAEVAEAEHLGSGLATFETVQVGLDTDESWAEIAVGVAFTSLFVSACLIGLYAACRAIFRTRDW